MTLPARFQPANTPVDLAAVSTKTSLPRSPSLSLAPATPPLATTSALSSRPRAVWGTRRSPSHLPGAGTAVLHPTPHLLPSRWAVSGTPCFQATDSSPPFPWTLWPCLGGLVLACGAVGCRSQVFAWACCRMWEVAWWCINGVDMGCRELGSVWRQTDVFRLAFIAFVSSIAEGGDVRRLCHHP